MTRSEQIPAEVPDKFKPLTLVKRGPQNTRLPHRFADTCAALARTASLIQGGEGK
jgi:hypothetical protein